MLLAPWTTTLWRRQTALKSWQLGKYLFIFNKQIDAYLFLSGQSDLRQNQKTVLKTSKKTKGRKQNYYQNGRRGQEHHYF